MGMSASQARLLSLTSRLSDLELKAQMVDNSKIRLSQAEAEAADNYNAALSKQNLTVLNGATASTYVDATAYNLTTYDAISDYNKQFFLQDSAGEILVNKSTGDSYNKAMTTTIHVSGKTVLNKTAKEIQTQFGTLEKFLNAEGYTSDANGKTETKVIPAHYEHVQGEPPIWVKETTTTTTYSTDSKAIEYYTDCYYGKEAFMQAQGYTSDPNGATSTSGSSTTKIYDATAAQWYERMFDSMKNNGFKTISDTNFRSKEWLYQQLNAGNIYLAKYNSNNQLEQISWSSGDASLQTETDNVDTTKAEAAYQATMNQLEAKDKQFDLELSKINTEHTAVQTEIDSVKKVIDKNIDRSFKIFDA